MKKKFDRFIYALAPMAGVTDFAFRQICADLGADMVTTEMISAKALSYDSAKTIDLLHETSHAHIRCVQLFGHDADVVASVCGSDLLREFDVIDFNCGCPAPKIVNNGDGSAMMRDIDSTEKVLSALVQHSGKPVSVKFRLGIDGHKNYIEFAKMCERVGVSFLTLHARTREQMYSGSVDFDAYRELRHAVSIPIIASGDILTTADVDRLKDIGIDGVMIGRGSMGAPEIFSTLKGLPVTRTKKDIVKQHFTMLDDFYHNDAKVIPYFRKHLAWYVSHQRGASELRKIIFTLETKQQILDFINKNF